MAISGSLNYEGLEITGSYTNITNLTYRKSNNINVISFDYALFVNEEHRRSEAPPLLSNRTQYSMSGSHNAGNLLQFSYEHIKKEPYFTSSSFIDC